MIKYLTVAAVAMAMAATAAFADEKPSDEEAAKIKEAVAAWGCEGGEYEKESEGSGVFEIDDAKCKDGNQYDIKLDKEFTLTSMTRD